MLETLKLVKKQLHISQKVNYKNTLKRVHFKDTRNSQLISIQFSINFLESSMKKKKWRRKSALSIKTRQNLETRMLKEKKCTRFTNTGSHLQQ